MPTDSSEKAKQTTTMTGFEDDIAAELAKIKNDITVLTETLIALSESPFEATADGDFDPMDAALETAHDALQEMQHGIESFAENANRKVAENPVQSLLIAAGLGFIAACLVRR